MALSCRLIDHQTLVTVLRAPPRCATRPAQVLAVCSAVATWFLLVLGSTVRVTESGMGCAGWPLCNGSIAPTKGFHAAMEQSHRYVAAAVTVFVMATLVAVLRARPMLRRALPPAYASVAMVGVQVVLGAVTVATRNAPPTVALHLLAGLLFAATITATAVATFFPDTAAATIPPGFRTAAHLIAVVATFAVMESGSVVVDGNAARSCPSWPFCRLRSGQTRFEVVQLVHRSVVLVATIAIASLVIALLRDRDCAPVSRVLAVVLSIALGSQIVVGAATAILGAPDAMQDVHLALAATVWMVLVALVMADWYRAHPSGLKTLVAVSTSGMPLESARSGT